MKTNTTKLIVLIAILLAVTVPGYSETPLAIQGETVLASVNGEWITLDDLITQVGSLHAGMGESGGPSGMVETPDPSAFLERMVNVQLVVQEARNIGLDQLPEITKQFEAVRLNLLKDAVVAERMQGITQGDPADVERLFRGAVRELKIGSVLFPSMEAATSFQAQLEAGAQFDELARRLLDEGTALDREEGDYLEASQLQPAVAEVIDDLEPGEISAPVTLPAGVAVMRLIEVRYPENPEARARAEEGALAIRQQLDLTEYTNELREQYATFRQEEIDSLDFDSPSTDLDALRADRRVVVKIKGGEPITVGELTARLDQRIYHGIERAKEQQRVNDEVRAVLERIIQERATQLEAQRLEIEKRPSFRSSVRAQEEGLIFGKFVNKVVDPNVNLTDEEVQRYYSEHLSDYSTPHMIRLESLVFQKREDAEAALQKLRQGADLNWMRANASGQVDPDAVAAEWRLEGQVLPLSGLPDSAQDALAGATAGDFRFWEESAASFHVLRVVQSVESKPQDYEAVKKSVAGRVFADKRQEALDHWIAQLRGASEIKIRVEGGELKELLGLSAEEDG